MEGLERIISEHPFFADLDGGYLETIVGCASNAQFSPREFVYRTGERRDTFYLIRQGTVALEVHAAQIGTMRIQTVTSGGIIGWSWLVPPYRAHFDARAMEVTRALAFDAACLREKMESDPRLGYELMKRFSSVMIRRLEAAQLQLLDLYGDIEGSHD